MQLSEFFKEYSVDTIVAKTKISKETLQKLANEDWSQFKKVQVLGFLKIIEREFGVDLSEARESCIAYFNAHQSKSKASTKTIDLVDAEQAPKQGNFFITFILTILTFVALAYALWYFLRGDKKAQPINVEQNVSVLQEKKASLFQNSIKAAKEAVESVKKTMEQKEQNNTPTQTKITLQSEQTPKQENQEEKHQKFNITPTQEENNTTKQEQNQSLSQEKNETNSKKAQERNKITSFEREENANKTNEPAQTNEKEATVQTEEENLSQNSLENTSNASSENLPLKNEINASNQEQKETTNSNIDSIKITPKSKSLWIGIYNLKTHKKVSKIIKKSFTYQNKEGALAIVTGHGLFRLQAGSITKEPKSKKKQYIIIDENGIRFINKSEYRKLTKKRAW